METIKPHWAWFFAGPVVFVIGCIIAFVILIGGTLSVASSMERVDVPGEGVVTIEEAGPSAIFFEQSGVAQASVPDGLVVKVTPAAGGEPLPLTTGGANFTYNSGGVAGRNYRNVDFPSAGQYRVVTELPPGSHSSGQIALGGDPSGALVGTLGGFFGVGFLAFVLCVVMMATVAVKRSKSAKRIRQQQYQQMPPQGPPPGTAYQ